MALCMSRRSIRMTLRRSSSFKAPAARIIARVLPNQLAFSSGTVRAPVCCMILARP